MKLRRFFSLAKEELLRLFFVPACPVCKIPGEEPICEACKKRLDALFSPWDIFRKGMCFDHAVSAFEYGEYEVLRLVHSVKFRGVDHAITVAGEAMYAAVYDNRYFSEADLITWIPRGAEAVRKRGFDQGELLATYLSERMGIPCKQTLFRTGQRKVQHKLTKEQRAQNMKGAFSCPEQVFGGVVILVDDVITTGSSVNEGAKMLKRAGYDRVRCLCLASVDPRKNNYDE